MNDEPRRPGGAKSEDWLESWLRALEPPPPSDTLRARLKRDFPDGAVAGAPRTAWRHAWGAPAVAASLALAVAAGILATPAGPERRAVQAQARTLPAPAEVPAAAPAGNETWAMLPLVDDGLDAAEFRVVLVRGGAFDENGPAPEDAEPFDGLPLE